MEKTCALCNEKIPESRRCKNHSYEEIRKEKLKVWNDPWMYYPIGLFSFWFFLLGVGELVLIDFMKYTVQTLPIELLIGFCFLSFGFSISMVSLVHYYRQKRKGLEFPFDNKGEGLPC